jgi:CMP-N,N'-diacetyllegionaminic acid synthase
MDNAHIPEILAIILARGGSKRLPRKNILPLRGKPLIAWTIERARNSQFIHKIVVSTDDKDIAQISKTYGAIVPFIRPAALAGDDSPSVEAVVHALDFLKERGYNPAVVILLQPTSPLRRTSDIDRALELFLHGQCKSVVSVCELNHPLTSCFTIANNYMEPLLDKIKLEEANKSMKIYVPNGAVYITSTQHVRSYNSFFSKETLPYVMPPHRSIDIDSEADFYLVDHLMGES